MIDAGEGNDRIGNPISGRPIDPSQARSMTVQFWIATTTQYATELYAGGDDQINCLEVVEGITCPVEMMIDWLYGYGGDDVLIGGAGDDFLYGYGGADRFVFDFTQSGQDDVYDNGLFTEDDVIGYLMEGRGLTNSQAVEFVRSADASAIQALKTEFPGVFPEVNDTVRINAICPMSACHGFNRIARVALASIFNRWPAPDTSVAVWMRGPNDFFGFGIERFEFADVTLTQAELVATLPPVPSEWPIEGTADADYLQGSDSADILVGKAGDDDLEGERGMTFTSTMPGTVADYILDYNYGEDAGIDTVSLGMGINPADVRATFQIEDYGDEVYYSVYLYFGETGTDSLWLDWDYSFDDGTQIIHESSKIEYLQFLSIDGGQVFDLAAIVDARQE